MGLKVFHAPSGKEALNLIRDEKPDLLLLDINLPDMVGWQILDKVKEIYSAQIPPAVITITSYGDTATRLMGKLQNVFEHLTKPFGPEELEAAVNRYISSKI